MDERLAKEKALSEKLVGETAMRQFWTNVKALLGNKVETTDPRLSDSRTPKAHTHGNISNTGTIASGSAIASGDNLLVTTSSGTIKRSTVAIGADRTKFLSNAGTWLVPPDTKYNVFSGASSIAGGSSGLVPAPAKGDESKVLAGSGTWIKLTQFSDQDKEKLDGIATGATVTRVTQIVSTGKRIATITINGSPTDIYADANTDTKVTNTLNTTAKAYITGTTSATTNTGTQVFDTGVYLGTTAGTLYATTFYGALSGNASTATKATQDSAGQTINTTYVKGVSQSGRTITITKGDGTTSTFNTQDTTYSAFKAATSSAAGGAGLVPAPAMGDQNKYLRADATWQTPTNTTYSTGTATTPGITKLYTATGSASDGTMTQGAITTALNGKAASTHSHNNYYSTSGGTLTTSQFYGVTIKRSDTNGSATQYSNSSGALGGIGFSSTKDFVVSLGTGTDGDLMKITSAKAVTFGGSVTAPSFVGSLSGNASSASTATKATQDSAGQTINTTYVKSVTQSGRTITVTKGNGTTSTFTTQDTTYSAFKGASSSAAGGSGLVPAPAKGDQSKFLRADATWQVPTNTTYAVFKAATSSATGGTGLVPAPAAGAQTKYLRGDATWQTPPNTTYSVVTTSTNGLMSTAMLTKLNGITDSADSVSFARTVTSGTKLATITINGSATDIYAPTITLTTKNKGTSEVTVADLPA